MPAPIRAIRSLYARIQWVWQQESAWADAITAGALAIWSAFDIFSAPGVTDRAAFAAFGWMPDGLISAITTTVTLFQASVLLLRWMPGRVGAAFLQGVFWGTVSITLLGAPTGVVPLTVSGTLILWAASWFSLVRVTRRYVTGA